MNRLRMGRASPVLVVLLLLLLAAALVAPNLACSVDTPSEGGRSVSTLAAGAKVQLQRAHVVFGNTTASGVAFDCIQSGERPDVCFYSYMSSKVRGVVEVAPGGTSRKVSVVYQVKFPSTLGNAWRSVDAKWVAGNLFEFETEAALMTGSWHYIPKHTYQLAIRYDVDGATYWDNNGGKDHVVSAGDLGGFAPVDQGPPAILQGGDLVVERASYDGSRLRGSVLVRNVAYQKTVGFNASADGWKTVLQGTGTYSASIGYNFERWTFEQVITNGPSKTVPAMPTEVVFSVYLQAAGTTQWDNNLGRDYRISLDGASQPWAVGKPLPAGQLVLEGPAKGWAVKWLQKPQPGGLILMSYSAGRTSCHGGHTGFQCWSVAPYYRFNGQGNFGNGGIVTGMAGTPYTDPGYLPSLPITAPLAATSIELYFKNSDCNSCTAWDSNFGQNFVLPF